MRAAGRFRSGRRDRADRDRERRRVAAYEDRTDWMDDPRYTLYDDGDLFGAPASGSARYDAMAVVPCSMGMAGRIASGVSDSLASRAADVMLKERRRLCLSRARLRSARFTCAT